MAAGDVLANPPIRDGLPGHETEAEASVVAPRAKI
jgi:hypothetical protein